MLAGRVLGLDFEVKGKGVGCGSGDAVDVAFGASSVSCGWLVWGC